MIGSSLNRTPVASLIALATAADDGDDAGLAEALGAERSLGVDGLDQADLDLRHVVGLEDRVVHEGLRSAPAPRSTTSRSESA